MQGGRRQGEPAALTPPLSSLAEFGRLGSRVCWVPCLLPCFDKCVTQSWAPSRPVSAALR